MRAALLVGLVLVAGCGKREDERSDTVSSDGDSPLALREPVAKLTAQKLFDDYDQNVIGADEKYKGKIVEIEGLGKISRGAGGGYDVGYVIPVFPGLTQSQLARLPARERQWFRDGGYPPNVIAHLGSAVNPDAGKIAPGQKAFVTGTVTGSRKANVWKDFIVELSDCHVRVEKSDPPTKVDPASKGKK